MRHLPILLGAAFMTVSLLAGNGQAEAMPALGLDSAPIASSPVEQIGYYRHWHGGYHPYHYWGPHYYRPYRYYGYHHYRYRY